MKRQERSNKTGRILVAAMLVVAAASCAKAPAELDPTGAAIRFGAATDYPNDTRTRTEYSGFDENGAVVSSTSKYERIDWVAEHDRVRIISAQARDKDGNLNPSGDYAIGTPSAAGKVSEAGATPATGTSLFYWVNGETYTFYALYPAPGTTSNYHEGTVSESASTIESISGDRAKITGSIPASQPAARKGEEDVYMPNMNFAYMYAQKRTARTDDNYVKLDFYPLVTAMEFSLKALDDAMGLYDLETLKLSSTSSDMSGSFEATLDAGANTASLVTTGTCGREITVTFPAGTKLKKGSYTKVTVLTLGVPQTDLTLKLNFSNGHSRSLLLKKANGTMVSVGACKKAYFQLGVPGDEIFFEVTPMTSWDASGSTTYAAATRGLDEIDNSPDRGLVPQRFGVFAWRNGENVAFDPAGTMDLYLDNHDTKYLETLASGNTYWRGNPSAYWPSFDRLNFFAYAPYMAKVHADESGVPPLVFPSADYTAGMPRATYTPNSLVNSQVDLCIGTPRFDRTKDDNPVPFTFKHALTRVRLYVKMLGSRMPEGDGYRFEYRVTNAILSGLVGTNTFTYRDNESAPFVWDPITASTPKETEYRLMWDESPTSSLTSNWLKFEGDAGIGPGVTDPYTWINSLDNGRLYLLPQTITPEAAMEIDISMFRLSGGASTLQSVLPPFSVSIPADVAWEAGGTVSYLITLDVSRLVVVDIKAMVSEWEDAGNTHETQTIF